MPADEEITRARTSAAAPGSLVVIGTSAGGLGALRTLLGAVPADSGAAFIVAAECASSTSGSFAQLLQPYTRLTVREAENGAALEPNIVLVVPPGDALAAVDEAVRLVPGAPHGTARARIDGALRAAAAARGGRSIGVA